MIKYLLVKNRAGYNSISVKLALLYTISAFLLASAAVLVLYYALAHLLNRQVRDFLYQEVAIITTVLQHEKQAINLSNNLKQEIIIESHLSRMPYFVRLMTQSGQVLIQTPGMDDVIKPQQFIMPDATTLISKIVSLKKIHDVQYSLISAYVKDKKRNLIVQVALNTSYNEEVIGTYQSILFAVLFFNVLLSILIGVYITKNGLRPLNKINNLLNKIHPDELNTRLNPKDFPSELQDTMRGLNNMLARIEHSFKKLQEFSDDLAHELKTPVNNMLCQIEVTLNKERPTKDYQDILLSNLEECQRISALIDSMLFIAKAHNLKQVLKYELIDVRNILDAITEYYNILAVEKCLSMQISGNGMVLADSLLLKRAFSNLISNGIKYSKENGNISINISSDSQHVKICIMDNGIGIPAKDIPYIFDRFYRVERSRSRDQGGMGLGLSIVKSIIELHEGEIKVASEANRHTTVTVILPAKMTKL
jgi:two-component system heavy metal sensor histidine kinase CusS